MVRRIAGRKVAVVTVAGSVIIIAAGWAIRNLGSNPAVAMITGAITQQASDPRLQRPVGSAKVTVRSGSHSWKSVSESSGLFRVRLNPPVSTGELLEIHVEHPDYNGLIVTTAPRDQLYILRLTPKQLPSAAARAAGVTTISNVRVRYAIRTTTTDAVGTAVKTFEVVNKGNEPCIGRQPCSPDGKWKATVGSLSLDTGEENKQFRNVRVSCIAGPCPFTAIEQDRYSRGGRSITVSVRNWSDPVTYLVEAEVSLTMENELIRYTYPVTFGASMNFTLPAAASGPGIEAEMNGSQIVFPLGPQLHLSWANCRFESGTAGTKQYRCELKPGYRFP